MSSGMKVDKSSKKVVQPNTPLDLVSEQVDAVTSAQGVTKMFSWALDATLIVSFFFGVFYLTGYAFHESLLIELGIPPQSAELIVQVMATFGSVYYLVVFLGCGASLFVLGALTPIGEGFFKKKDAPKRSVRLSASDTIMAQGVVVFVLGITVFICMSWASGRGKDAAATLKSKCDVLEIEQMDGAHARGCFVANAKDGMWFIEMDEKKVRAPIGVLYVPSNQIRMIKTLNPAVFASSP